VVKLTDKLAVTADDFQYIVGTPSIENQRGGEYARMRHPKFFPTMADAVKYAASAAVRDKLSAGEIASLHEFITEHERITAEFKRTLHPLEC